MQQFENGDEVEDYTVYPNDIVCAIKNAETVEVIEVIEVIENKTFLSATTNLKSKNALTPQRRWTREYG